MVSDKMVVGFPEIHFKGFVFLVPKPLFNLKTWKCYDDNSKKGTEVLILSHEFIHHIRELHSTLDEIRWSFLVQVARTVIQILHKVKEEMSFSWT